MSTKSPPTKKARHDEEAQSLELKCINTIRALSADQPSQASSGHPGAPMGCAPIAHILFSEYMTFAPPEEPNWWNRDRFVLSNGHACALLYSMLHLCGYEDLKIDDLKSFRKLGSKTPGHPECFMTGGVEVCTGPLGQGLTNAIGLAIAQRHLSTVYNTPTHSLFTNHTYVLCGDGCLQEGITSEASSLAGHLGLGKLIVFYDDNQITIDGSTELSFTENVKMRYESYGWHVQEVDDVVGEGGLKKLREAIEEAQGEERRPSLIKVKTVIGFGSVNEGTEKTHGAPLKMDDLVNAKKKYGMEKPEEMFVVGDEVSTFYKERVKVCQNKRDDWNKLFAEYQTANAEKASEMQRRFSGTLPPDLFTSLPTFKVGTDKDLATRKYSEKCLNAIAPNLIELMGGSADLTGSNLTALKCSGDFQKDTPGGRYLRFGVREHAMAAISNGLFAYGGFRPFCATFLNFAGYALGAIRLSALSNFGVLYIMTHDSIGLGEDGPTHQPVEMLESLRSLPNLMVFRPADSDEMCGAYRSALQRRTTPSVICCSRSAVKGLEGSDADKVVTKGGYIVHGQEGTKPDLIIIATGSEVGPCIDALPELESTHKLSVRVVSMPCQEIFLEQSLDYQKSILPGDIPTLSVEAGSDYGWHRFSHAQIAVKRFGMSGKGSEVFEKFGFCKENIASKGKALVDFYKDLGSVPNLMARPTFDNMMGKDSH